jgi:hypothetical protein
MIFQFFRSFAPFQNPIGFGASDFIEFVLAGLLVLPALAWRPWIEPLVGKLVPRTDWCMLLLAALPVLLRLALLANHPVPTPEIYDEFGHLLVADTLRHFRLTNPPHALHQFFETLFVLQKPTYSSIYPIGQGMALAIGRLTFGHPWAGVLLSEAAFCSLCYWMLRGWTTPDWALLGGFLAVAEFGPLNGWMNSYWGGALSATAGCLVFGSLPRLRATARVRDAIWLGIGLGLQLLARPYEFILLIVGVLLYFLPTLRKRQELRMLARVVPALALAVAPAAGLTLLHNKQVTGSWVTLPYLLSRYQYGVPVTFAVQPNPLPHQQLTQTQQLIYTMQTGFHGRETDTLTRYFHRLEYRVRDYRFFFFAPLYIALFALLSALREFGFVWVVLTLLIFALGSNFYPFFFPHYIAAATCLFVLVSIKGLERLSRLSLRGLAVGNEAARLIIWVCFAQFAFWYGVHVFDGQEFSIALRQYESWDAINHGNPERRIAVLNELARAPGKHLVFVRYWPQHPVQEEWVFNAADIDGARVVWALDLGPAENEKLRRYYPDRAAWRLEPDARPTKLLPYLPEPLTNVEGP